MAENMKDVRKYQHMHACMNMVDSVGKLGSSELYVWDQR